MDAGILANAFVANHDTERGASSLSYKSSSNTYTLAMAVSLAHLYGTPPILNLCSFGRGDASGPNSFAETCSRGIVPGETSFQNAVGSSAMIDWATGTTPQIAFGRESIDFAVITNADSSWSTSFTTSLPGGVYCDVYTCPTGGSSCSGISYTQSGGMFSATVVARTGLALHTSAVLSLSLLALAPVVRPG